MGLVFQIIKSQCYSVMKLSMTMLKLEALINELFAAFVILQVLRFVLK